VHGRAKRQVAAMFQEEKPHLRPLPLAPFRYFTDGVRTVYDDTTITVDGASYGARPAATIEDYERLADFLLCPEPKKDA
jgi:hypothetical protein